MKRRNFLKIAAIAPVAASLSSKLEAAEKMFPLPLSPLDEDTVGGSATLRELSDDTINVRFIGTGAADWRGRDERGELRRNTSILVDYSFLIDLTSSGLDMLPKDCHPKTIFYTHSHNDHYEPKAAISAGVEIVYVGETWIEKAKREFEKAAQDAGVSVPEVLPLKVGQSVESNGIKITPLPGNHTTSNIDEQALIYLLEKGPVRLLYATDTAGIPSLAAKIAGLDSPRGKTPLTGMIMEATMGLGHEIDYRIFTHSSVAMVKNTVDVLKSTGKLTPRNNGEKVYITHLGKTLHGTQEELDKTLPEPLAAAFDGLEVEFR